MMKKSIVITREDYNNVIRILDRASFVDPLQKACLSKLLFELEKADIVPNHTIAPEIVRMGSSVDIKTPFGTKDGLILVVPEDADFNRKRISVISPLGSALLGYAEGDRVEWPLRNGNQVILISRVNNKPSLNSTEQEKNVDLAG